MNARRAARVRLTIGRVRLATTVLADGEVSS